MTIEAEIAAAIAVDRNHHAQALQKAQEARRAQDWPRHAFWLRWARGWRVKAGNEAEFIRGLAEPPPF